VGVVSNQDRLAKIRQRRLSLDGLVVTAPQRDAVISNDPNATLPAALVRVGWSERDGKRTLPLPPAVQEALRHAPDDIDWLVAEVEYWRAVIGRLPDLDRLVKE
jgi:hypothetical protein